MRMIFYDILITLHILHIIYNEMSYQLNKLNIRKYFIKCYFRMIYIKYKSLLITGNDIKINKLLFLCFFHKTAK